MSTKRYRLLKDFPGVKAGTIYFKDEEKRYLCGDRTSYIPDVIGMRHERWAIHSDYVENNPEWFSLIEEEEKKEFQWTDELVLEFFRFTQSKDRDRTGYYTDLEDFKSSHQSIKEEQGSEIKCVIEKGMVIECLTNENWDVRGQKIIVKSVSIPENTVLFENGFMITLSGLITGLENGRYKIVEQPQRHFNEIENERIKEWAERYSKESKIKRQNPTEERLRWSERKKEKAAFDWEIVLWWDGKNHEKAHEYEYGDKSCENVGCKIYAVKRLSDGEIFAIGHEVDAPEFSVSGTIISFKKESYGMIALLRPVLDRRGRINTCNLYNLQKKIPAQPQPTKERTEVTFLSEYFGDKPYVNVFWSTKKISPNEFEPVTKAIESALNDEGKTVSTSGDWIIDTIDGIAYLNGQKLYTQEQADEIARHAFDAARIEAHDNKYAYKYSTYQDYKKSKA